jgi:hypothetical protein
LSSEVLDRVFRYALALQLILGSLLLLETAGVVYHPNIHRATRPETFSAGFDLSWPLMVVLVVWGSYYVVKGDRKRLLVLSLLGVGLFDIELGVLFASWAAFLVGVNGLGDYQGVLNAFMWVVAFANGLAVLHYAALVPVWGTSFLEVFSLLQLRVHYVLAHLSPLLVLPFLYFWVLKPLIRTGFRLPELGVGRSGFSRLNVLMIVFSLYLSLLAAIYPYFELVNPGGVGVGVDIPFYVRSVNSMVDGESSVVEAAGGSKIFFYIFYFFFKWVAGLSVDAAVRFQPLVLNPLLVASLCFFSWEVFGNGDVVAWSGFFMATGLNMTVGMYAYFLSNSLGLVLAFSSLGFLFRYLKKRGVSLFWFSSLLGALLVFTHPWTMDQYIFSLVPLIFLLWWEKPEGFMDRILSLTYYIVVIFLAEMVKILVFGGLGGTGATKTVGRHLTELAGFWASSFFSFHYLYGGYMSHCLLFILAFIGVLMMRAGDESKHYLLSMLFFSSLVFFLSDETTKSRLLYNIPLGLFSSVALALLGRRCSLSVYFLVFFNSLFYLFMSLNNLV